MNPTKNKRVLFLGALFLSLSCNKGDFDPTLCDNCPELTSCYDGICDCDTTISDKFWNRCYEKEPTRFVCLDPDTRFGMTAIFMDSMFYIPDRNVYRYKMYSDEEAYMFFRVNLMTHAAQYDISIKPQPGYDSVFMSDDFLTHVHNGNMYSRYFQGKRFGTDSMELQIFLWNADTYTFDDTSRVMTFRRL